MRPACAAVEPEDLMADHDGESPDLKRPFTSGVNPGKFHVARQQLRSMMEVRSESFRGVVRCR